MIPGCEARGAVWPIFRARRRDSWFEVRAERELPLREARAVVLGEVLEDASRGWEELERVVDDVADVSPEVVVSRYLRTFAVDFWDGEGVVAKLAQGGLNVPRYHRWTIFVVYRAVGRSAGEAVRGEFGEEEVCVPQIGRPAAGHVWFGVSQDADICGGSEGRIVYNHESLLLRRGQLA